MSIVPVAIVAGVAYHLARQGAATRTVWIGLNVLDSARALKTTRVNGRSVGVRTRRRALRQAMACWVVYVAIQQLGAVPDRLFAWLPLYSVFRTIAITAFLFARASMSESIYASFIQPTVKRYEDRIDLTLLLFHSIASLFFHFVVRYPLDRLQSAARPLVDRTRKLVGLDRIYADLEVPTDITFGSVDDDAPTVSISDLQPSNVVSPTGISVRQKAARLAAARVAPPSTPSTPALITAPRTISHTSQSKVSREAAPSRPTPRESLALGRVAHATTNAPSRLMTNPTDSRLRVLSDKRVQRSTAPTPESHEPSSTPTFLDKTREEPLAVGLQGSASNPTRPASSTSRPSSGPLRSKASPKTRPNPLSQPPRRIPIARDANVPKQALSLVKSKSTIDLGTKKTSSDARETSRPIKSAPTRRPPTLDSSASTTKTSPSTRRVPSAAERARALRTAKRKEEAVDVGEKRKSVRAIGPEGSKRTRVHIAKD